MQSTTNQLPELPWAFIDCPTDDLVTLIGPFAAYSVFIDTQS
jgi:hypothetical protein